MGYGDSRAKGCVRVGTRWYKEIAVGRLPRRGAGGIPPRTISMRDDDQSLLWRLNRKLKGGGFLSNVVVLAGGVSMAQAILVLASPVLTRLFVPKEFGVVAVYSSMLSILTTVASLCYESAIPLPKKPREAANLLVLSGVVVVIMASLVGVVVLARGNVIATRFGVPALERYLWLLPLSLLGAGFYQSLSLWAVRKKQFSLIAQTRLGQNLLQVAIQFTLGALGAGPIGLISGVVAAQFGGIGRLASVLRAQDGKVLRRVSLRGIGRSARRYERFPLLGSGSSLLKSAGIYLPSILITASFGAQAGGWYALAERVASLPIGIIGQATGLAFFGEASQLAASRDGAALSRLLGRTVRWLAIPSLILLVTLGLFGPVLVTFVFGARWAQAGRILRAMTPMIAAALVVSPVSWINVVVERQDIAVVLDVLRVMVTLLCLGAPRYFGLELIQCVALYSLIVVLHYGLTLLLYWHTIWN